jgi:uncharacterized small protein (DUF1192 family)
MSRSIISNEEKEFIIETHMKAGYNTFDWSVIEEDVDPEFEMTERKMESVEDLEKQIKELEKKIEELKAKKSKKKETKEDEFDSLVDADIDVEDERDSLEQS